MNTGMSARLRALKLLCAGACVCCAGVTWAETADVPLSSLTASAPKTGTLDAIDTTWSVDAGERWEHIGEAGGYYHYTIRAPNSQTWTFGKKVDLRFKVLGLNGTNEGVYLTVGTHCDAAPVRPENFLWTPGTGLLTHISRTVSDDGAVQIDCQLAGTETLGLEAVGSNSWRRGLGALSASIPELTTPEGPLPGGTVGEAYGPGGLAFHNSDPFVTDPTAADDDRPLLFEASDPAPADLQPDETAGLPPGLAFDAGGQLTGTPTTPGTYRFVVKLTNHGGVESFSKTYTMVIAEAAAAPPGGGGVTAVPTLSELALAALALMLGALGWRQYGRGRQT